MSWEKICIYGRKLVIIRWKNQKNGEMEAFWTPEDKTTYRPGNRLLENFMPPLWVMFK